MQPAHRVWKRQRLDASYVCHACRLISRQRRNEPKKSGHERAVESQVDTLRGDGSLQLSKGAGRRFHSNALPIASRTEETSAAPAFVTISTPHSASIIRHVEPQITQTRLRSKAQLRPFSIRQSSRPLHTSHNAQQGAAAAVRSDLDFDFTPGLGQLGSKDSAIRTQLRQWQELHGKKEIEQIDYVEDVDTAGLKNNLTRLPSLEAAGRSQNVEEEEEEEERSALAEFAQSPTQDLDNVTTDKRFLNAGDLVELEFPSSERESEIAVFIRRLGSDSQFFTMNGRWAHMPDRLIPFSIPGWISPDLIDPILPYLPSPRSQQEKDELYEQAYINDLNVPRRIASPLVTKLVQFYTESQDVYRRHASALDDAHNILSHETDLRYGSLHSAAATLLKIPQKDLPDTALFTVRKALSRASFAFNIDRRSHRLTGHIQIRSKEQVKMVENVRGWIRDWQDSMAMRSGTKDSNNMQQNRTYRIPKSAQHVYGFLRKARGIIVQSRKDRDITDSGNIGPSKKRFPLTPITSCVKVTLDPQFTVEEEEIIRFIEAWACASAFRNHPRLSSLPPLLLQATGLYDHFPLLTNEAGFVFLQEIGTIMPYENRVRFDQHLLLPSSQHSRPLQQLMTSLLDMRNDPQLSDSMSHLRHNWKSLSVYCIDGLGAREIDDGISVERAGSDEWWVHIHIANPTAFFDKNHALAKMASHMGESIYMPERAYNMLPAWVAKDHFSLAKNRPCLTISAKLNAQGHTLEHKIQSGIVRNVLRLTPDEVDQALGSQPDERPKVVLTVGGEPPPPSRRRSLLNDLTVGQIEELKTLRMLADKRTEIRKQAGGIFFDQTLPELEVWSIWRSSGLGWDHPFRKGARRVEGDPIIRMQTSPLGNWFQPRGASGDVIVREMMLLACETAAKWCAQRQIPGIFRGTVRQPDSLDPAVYHREILEPATRAAGDGVYPMHLGIKYVRNLGVTVLSTKPVNHDFLGMDHFAKVTSPLRRYGDMILHWQIDAALREEARTGRSLVTEDQNANRSFLPFSRPVLDSIMTALQPRENTIMKAKRYSQVFWENMLLFRAFHYDEAELPFYTEARPAHPDGTPKPYARMYVSSPHADQERTVNGVLMELNIQSVMRRPELYDLETPQLGDIWECTIEKVDLFRRCHVLKPVRLAHRETLPEWTR